MNRYSGTVTLCFSVGARAAAASKWVYCNGRLNKQCRQRQLGGTTAERSEPISCLGW